MKRSIHSIQAGAAAVLLAMMTSCGYIEDDSPGTVDAFTSVAHAGLAASAFYGRNDRWPSGALELAQFATLHDLSLNTNVFAELRFVPTGEGTADMVYRFAPPLTGTGTGRVSVASKTMGVEPVPRTQRR